MCIRDRYLLPYPTAYHLISFRPLKAVARTKQVNIPVSYTHLDVYKRQLEDHKEWRPNVYGQCKSWLDMGLQPRAVSRDLDWGIPVPVEGAEGKVLYVWFDAPIGYISNTKELLPDSVSFA